jgi:hypothetical protein
MSRKKRMKDIREAKDKRAKKLAVGGAVLLAVVIAFEVPKVLKHGGSSSSAPPAATTTAAAGAPTAPATAPATTPPGTAAAAVLPTTTGSTKLPDSDQAPKRSKSQLYTFSRFAGKDPFVQQVTDLAAGQPDAETTAAVTHSAASAPATAAPASSSGPQTSSARTLAKSGAVTISVNGKIQTVRLGASFPSSNPLFRLVSVVRGVAKVGIANGSYASGTQTVALTAGKTLTLVDTSTGAHYKLRLVS